MNLVTHPEGQYRFLPGIAPYSCGVVSLPGYEIAHVRLSRAVPWRMGFELVERFLSAAGRPRAALCAMELRSPKPFSFPGFAEFNGQYAAVLQQWGLFVDGVNPIARTNVAPLFDPPAEPSLFAFSYSRPSKASRPTFIVAGAGELPEGILARDSIVALGDLSPAGLRQKVEFVLELMQNRLFGLDMNWSSVTATDLYTVHPFDALLSGLIAPKVGPAMGQGLTWHVTRPPIEAIEFEMDLQGVVSELLLPID